MSTKNEKGFAPGIILVVLVAVGLVGWIGYTFFTAVNVQTSQSAQQTQAPAPVGTTASIDNLVTQEVSSEASINTSHAGLDQAAVENTNGTASNIGGAYDENSF